MQKGHKKIWCSIVAIILIVSFCVPFHVSADSGSYATFENGDSFITSSYYSSGYYVHICYLITSGNDEIRAVVLKQANDNKKYGVYLVSTSSFSARQKSFNDPNRLDTITNFPDGGTNSNAGQYTYNGITYYLIRSSFSNTSGYNSLVFNIPSYGLDTDPTSNTATNKDLAVYYTFGDGAVAPVPPVNHGDLIDLGYYTNFTNSQQSNYLQMRNNRDTISWNGYEDSNGNQINTIDYQVEIQAYATEYEAQTKQGLLGLTLTDLQNYGTPVTIYEGSANRGEFSVLWGDVADALNGTSTTIDFWSQMAPHSYENMWYSHGWLYRIRLKTSDESYIGQWQTIYTMASAPPKDAETVYNYYYYYGGQGITDDVVDVLYNINTSNNTSNVYYINGNQVDPSGGSSNWLETLLKFLADMIGKILDLFSSMFDSVLDFLLALIDGFDPVGTFTNWWNQLKLKFDSIDLTLPIFNIPDDEDLSGFGVLVQKTIEIYTTNGLGYMIFIPLLLLILKVIL